MADPEWPWDSVQALSEISPWWEAYDTRQGLSRGQLVRAFVPHADQSPYLLVPEGREDPTNHKNVKYRIESTKIGDPNKRPSLPVAAIPHLPTGEVRAVYRAKVRPCLVLSAGGPYPPKTEGAPSWQTFPTFRVAPYYGVDQGGTRGGWDPWFVERIRHGEYPQYAWDMLPLPGSTEESVLRFDQAQPIGLSFNSFKPLPWVLSKDALALLDEWDHWYTYGRWPKRENVLLRALREQLCT